MRKKQGPDKDTRKNAVQYYVLPLVISKFLERFFA